MGPLITILSIRVALLLFALALLGWALRLESSSTGGKAWRRRLRWAWTIGFGFFGIHVLSAFHFYHGWSHQAAVDDTARQTGELLGWRFGEGLYFSYLFLILWGVDALVRWRSPQEFRPRWLVALWMGYLGFIAFNGAAVFESGPTRWGAWVTVCILASVGLARTATRWLPQRRMTARSAMLLGAMVWLGIASPAALIAQEPDVRFKNFSIDQLIRFRTGTEAEQRREQLVKSIWPDGLPRARPIVEKVDSSAPELASIDRSLFVAAERWDVDVSQFDFHSLTFALFPKPQSSTGPMRLAIVHAGHMPEGPSHYLEAGLDQTANALLRQGYVVALMQMPLAGWNRDADGRVGERSFQIARRTTAGHDELFAATEPQLQSGTMRFFLEPVVQVTNELLARARQGSTLLMIGLSGGGWTTHMSAALDVRIDVSIPVAGAYPLYARPFSRGSKGDSEQEYAPIFREVDSDADGILDKADGSCSWLEIFALGALSPDMNRPRKQIQVLNYEDPCCFHGPVYQTYSDRLTARVEQIGGNWKVYVDRSHRSHLISSDVLRDLLAH